MNIEFNGIDNTELYTMTEDPIDDRFEAFGTALG
jgi:hypothetical protein